ncbi:hypothetical protein TRICI_005598 [Trichomonascus ciferrii]|uniref:proline--tRNA ligase n=1 Tax=Trichomonascus ciferrii TaxID=44093 RepID=A0A642UWI5_9ASCO|nr:hypothetical protein TRICI_005598 [Trichomonascus ciferrii]
MIPRLSRLFVPLNKAKGVSDVAELLVRNGYLRQSSSGAYNVLPLGVRVLQKVEGIVRRRMNEVEGAEVQLTSLSPSGLWKKSGRYGNKEYYHVDKDKYVLAPTCEEEITNVVSGEVNSYRQLPLRLYQITRKYRDEKRPRGGLLRTKEFVMKDMYTFDEDKRAAEKTYRDVQAAYEQVFADIGVPVKMAEADSGAIGGELSHEFHYLSDAGEDKVINCPNCKYTANIERAASYGEVSQSAQANVAYFVNEDRDNLVAVYYPPERTLNLNLVKAEVPDIDFSVENPVEVFVEDLEDFVTKRLVRIIDPRIKPSIDLPELPFQAARNATTTLEDIPVVDVEAGEVCPVCDKPGLEERRAIEVAHTFYLGQKYSRPFDANVTGRDDVPRLIEMGCYGIGISRILSAVAEVLKDEEGLRWPKSIAPADAVVVATDPEVAQTVGSAIQSHGVDVVWDDRSSQFGVVLGMARSMGFPLAIIAGKGYQKDGTVEIQQRNKSKKEAIVVPLDQAGIKIKDLLSQL